jgi:hypothetical protein
MKKLNRSYYMPAEIVEGMKLLPLKRSVVMNKAIDAAHDNPLLLSKAFQKRVERLQGPSEMVRAVFYISKETVDKAYDLANKIGIPLEIVIRLAIEAYIQPSSQPE